MHSRTAALVLLVVLALVWGIHWAVVKIGLDYLPPLTYAALRMAVALGVLVPFLVVRRQLRLPPRADLPVVVSVGAGQIAAGALIMNLALQVVAAGRSSVLVYTMPLWVAVILAVAFGLRPRRNEVIGLVLGLAGIAALLNPAAIDWSDAAGLWGSLALVLNAMLWAAATIHVRRHHWTASPLELAPWQILVAFLPLAAVALVTESGQPVRWEIASILILLYSGALATAFAWWASQAVTRSLGALASSIGFLAVPVVGLASGALILGERLGLIDIVGFALVLGGLVATSLTPPGFIGHRAGRRPGAAVLR